MIDNRYILEYNLKNPCSWSSWLLTNTQPTFLTQELPAALHSGHGWWGAECPLMLCCDTDENVPPWCNDIHDRAPGSAACDHHYHTSSRQLSAPLAGDGGDGDNVMKRCHSLWSRMQTRRGSDVWRCRNGECSFEYSTFSWMKVPSESFKMLLCWKSLRWQLGCLCKKIFNGCLTKIWIDS